MRSAFALWVVILLNGACTKEFVPTGGIAKTQDESDQFFELDGDYAASHILVSYRGAQQAAKTVKVSKEEAYRRAQELLRTLREEPRRFEEIAKEFSDDSSAERGGLLGALKKGDMPSAFEEIALGLEVDGIGQTLAETPLGFHLIRRDSLRVKHYAGYMFLIAFRSLNLPATIRRSREDAREKAERLKDDVNASSFEAFCASHNDLGVAPMFLGVLRESDPVPPELLRTLRNLDYGETGGPIELQGGFAFIKRSKVVLEAGSHILVSYRGAEKAKVGVVRSKLEAHLKAKKLIGELMKSPDLFEALAQAHSEDASVEKSGDLGVWFRGSMVPEFEQALRNLEVGEITPTPVETPFGYHVIRKNRLP